MSPVGRLVMLRAVSKAELVRAMAWLMIPATIGPILGPPVGGLIVTYLSWRWIFFINVPIGLLGMVLASLFIAEHRETESGRLRSRRTGILGNRTRLLAVRHRNGEPWLRQRRRRRRRW